MRLPCRHILRISKELQVTLFEQSTVAEHWTRTYYQTKPDTRFGFDNSYYNSVGLTKARKKETVLSQAQKYKRATQTILAENGGAQTTFTVVAYEQRSTH